MRQTRRDAGAVVLVLLLVALGLGGGLAYVLDLVADMANSSGS